jgi:DNA-binding NtrC family response regulator
VGGTDDIEVDIRTIAATNKDPVQLIKTGAFREDLYYRLNVISIEMPPLRDRREDIPLLAANFLGLFAARGGRNAMRLAPETMEILTAYAWPGNVRELENTMERAVALAVTDEVKPDNLPPNLMQPVVQALSQTWEVPPEGMNLEQVIADIEQALLKDALMKADGVQTRAAQLLGINFRSFRYRARKYGLDRHVRDRDDGGA